MYERQTLLLSGEVEAFRPFQNGRSQMIRPGGGVTTKGDDPLMARKPKRTKQLARSAGTGLSRVVLRDTVVQRLREAEHALTAAVAIDQLPRRTR